MRKAAALLALAGAVALGVFFFRSSARDVVLVYDLTGAPAGPLEVVIRKGDQVVRRAIFPAPGQQVRHAVRLTDGQYRVAYALAGPSGKREGRKDLVVTEDQTIVLPLAR